MLHTWYDIIAISDLPLGPTVRRDIEYRSAMARLAFVPPIHILAMHIRPVNNWNRIIQSTHFAFIFSIDNLVALLKGDTEVNFQLYCLLYLDFLSNIGK